jgi:hypothetical protein
MSSGPTHKEQAHSLAGACVGRNYGGNGLLHKKVIELKKGSSLDPFDVTETIYMDTTSPAAIIVRTLITRNRSENHPPFGEKPAIVIDKCLIFLHLQPA